MPELQKLHIIRKSLSAKPSLGRQGLLQSLDLLKNGPTAGSARGILQLYRTLVIKYAKHIVAEPFVDTLKLLDGKFVHALLLVFSKRNHPTCQMVGFTEWHT
jgi:hypothetical protein